MWSAIVKGIVLAILKAAQSFWERWRFLQDERQIGRLETAAEHLKKASEIEHAMAKVDATPASADDVSRSLRDGKF